ncbi:MAG: hypothetical protein ABIR17_10295 [Pseudolysinimonas sp.]|uniref:hypothetical protein n=1 Tax=Pseudolysinimonas sp. TaxID=2680009 RepID=UPI003264CDD2
MTRTSRAVVAIAALALLPLLAACGDPNLPAPTPSTSTTADGTPPASPDATVDDTRARATDATCAELAPAGTFDGLFSIPIVPVGPERTSAFVSTIIDETWLVEQAGGVACDWQGAGSTVGSEGLFDYRGVRILLVPISDGAWSDFSATQTDPGEDILNCGDGICRRDVHVNGWWLSLWGFEFESEARQTVAVAAYTTIVARVAALPSPRSVAHTSTLSSDCNLIVPRDRIAAAFGVSASSVLVEASHFPYLHDLVLGELGGADCNIRIDGVDVAEVQTVPGGADVRAEAVAAYNAIAGDQEELLAVPGLAEPGSFRPQVESSGFDIAPDGDWIKIIPWGGYGTRTLQETAVAIATIVVAAR